MFCSRILLLLLLLPVLSAAQAITNAPAYKNVSSDGYFRMCYENDVFAATDRYYTQGVDAELVLPQFNRLVTNRLFINPRFGYTRYGVGLQHNGYTPSSLGHDKIIYGDRPFAGVLLLKTFVVAIDSYNQQRFTSSIYAGMIGPAVHAGDMQKYIHRSLANIMPRGWDNQIHNDFLVNYNIGYEKQLLALSRYFSLSAAGQVSMGTLNCSAAFGSTIMAGYFLSPYTNERGRKSQLQVYAYDYPEIYIPFYDATLQGGAFHRTSPYVIFETNITRPVWRNRLGVVMAYEGVYLEYFATTISPEFSTGTGHAWGGVQLTVGF